jgi:heme oxygenase
MIMAQLKEATRPYHERIEHDPLSRSLNASQPSREYYVQVLGAYYGFYAPLEARIQHAASWAILGFPLEPRLKTPLLIRDLASLGLAEPDWRQLPLCPFLPALHSFPTALGCLYVLEGATLGGQLMARHLAQTLQLGSANGAAFFNSYGADVGVMWKAFRSFVDAQQPAAADAIVHGACVTFAALEQWFTESYVRIAQAALAS